ncbi:MAG: 23S rRNA pseudouridine(955/2504/2580) synthase RluC [Gammaproteobacteria bacterium]|nr:23S rRNA pseudouridine(955/2504/2580) synthase RluC [Gammaproteobacteria bacterium]
MSESPDFSRPHLYAVDAEDVGQRLDNFLLRYLKGVPKSRIYRILRKGEVRVNKGRVNASTRLAAGDQVRIPPIRVAEPEPAGAVPRPLQEQLERRILFEDEGLLVINKPSGLAVHGGSGLSFGLIEALRAMRPEATGLELVHRIDRDTSGCLLLAKKRAVLRDLHEQIRFNRVEKRYLALLVGRWKRSKLRVDAPLLKNVSQGGERVVRVDPRGKPAQTQFSVQRRFADYSLVEALLETGRTHQIRVHAAHLGTPIAGDDKYGDAASNDRLRELGLKRLFLHAASIGFCPPGDKRQRRFSAPLDEELESLLERLAV